MEQVWASIPFRHLSGLREAQLLLATLTDLGAEVIRINPRGGPRWNDRAKQENQ